MVLTKVEESIPIEQVQEVRYKEVTYIDAITDKDAAVKVVDTRRTKYYTESQVDAQITYWEGLKNEITTIKEVE
ncbi:MAG: hypothetical protein ACTSQA_00135 [Candidatus Heimdallarchaeaceae archaeon]